MVRENTEDNCYLKSDLIDFDVEGIKYTFEMSVRSLLSSKWSMD